MRYSLALTIAGEPVACSRRLSRAVRRARKLAAQGAPNVRLTFYGQRKDGGPATTNVPFRMNVGKILATTIR